MRARYGLSSIIAKCSTFVFVMLWIISCYNYLVILKSPWWAALVWKYHLIITVLSPKYAIVPVEWRRYIGSAIWDSFDDVIKWKYFPRHWPFVQGIHQSPVNSPHKGQWRGALMFSVICAWTSSLTNNGDAADLRHHRIHDDAIVTMRK